jgi:putative inorganic carbon (HCO3(-)) transporter
MGRALHRNSIVAACALFVVANVALMVHGHYWLNLLPVALLLGWALFMAPGSVLLFIAFATPLSINLEELEIGGLGVSLPTEPLMAAITVLFLLRAIMRADVIDRAFMRHPITVVILVQLAWWLITSMTSSMPLVSFKALAARLWFVVTAYFVASRYLMDPAWRMRFMHCFLAGLVIVVGYTLVRHAGYDFAHDPSHWVMEPFFKDHTSYGAILALMLPVNVAALMLPGRTATYRTIMSVLLVVLLTGMVFSYTRAAWVSLVGAAGMLVALRLKIQPWLVALVLVTTGGLYWAYEEEITIALERNREESSDDLGEHVRSISNISSDASNLERINRWNSALRMWEERPILGWGPGTYMFQYAPFQSARDRTIISTNFGTGGNAHSEYLGPLSEQGLPGLLIMVALVAVIAYTAMRLHLRMPPGPERLLMTATFLGLVTYYVHGLLNNYLDLDKASVPVWAFTAVLVLIDLAHPAEEKTLTGSHK